MSFEKHLVTEAFILKVKKTGEINRFFTFISPVFGVDSSTAFGAEKLKSRFCGSIQPFVNLKIFIEKNPKTNLSKLDDISEVETNDFLKTDIKIIYLMSFFSDVISNSYIGFDEAKSYFYLLKYSVEIIKEKNDLKIAFLFFTSKFLFLSGYNYNLDSCKKCNSNSDYYFFEIKQGGILCQSCSSKNLYKLSAKSAALWKDFLTKKYVELKKIEKIDNDIFIELFIIIIHSIKNIFEKELVTIANLRDIFS